MKMNSAITPTSREKGKNKKGFMEDMWNGGKWGAGGWIRVGNYLVFME